MIEQLLNREFMVAVAQGAHVVLDQELATRAGGPRRGGAPGPLDGFATQDLRDFAGALAQLPTTFTDAFAGDGEAPPIDDFVFLPNSPLMSILQSAVDEVVSERNPEAIEEPPEPDSTRRGAPPRPAVTSRRLRGVELDKMAGNRRIWKQMEVATGKWIWLSDPRWVLSAACELWRAGVRGRTTFVNRPATIRIANHAKLIILGDWGSGLPRAHQVADQVRAELAKGDGLQQVVIHLGDVYYSGTQREFKRRFLDPWPVPPGSEVISLAIPGNHELYSGGFAYYDRGLADDRFGRQNGCSYFAVENDHWQFLGLDTAYEDGGLHGDQAGWARGRIEVAPREMRTCLLSHHQLFRREDVAGEDRAGARHRAR